MNFLHHLSDELIVNKSFRGGSSLHKIVLYLLQISRALLYTKEELKNATQGLTDVDVTILEHLNNRINILCQDDVSFVNEILPLICGRVGISTQDVSTRERSVLAKSINFLKPTELLLTTGGDDRLTLNIEKGKQSKYYASTIPTDDVIRRGSCTCSTIVEEDLTLANTKREEFLIKLFQILQDEQADNDEYGALLQNFAQEFINRISDSLGLTSTHSANDMAPQVVLFPSGSDAEYLPLISALIRSYNLFKQSKHNTNAEVTSSADILDNIQVYNYVTAAGEVGSGTSYAANGQYFAPFTASGRSDSRIVLGEFVTGFDTFTKNIQVKQYKPRNTIGEVAFQEEDMLEDVSKVLQSSPFAVAVVHIVAGSKTGLIYPSLLKLQTLQARFPSRILPVIDACQLRSKLTSFAEYVNETNQCICLITGSKFFTGTPFAGAVLLPSTIAKEIDSYALEHNEVALIPEGMIDFITAFDIPSTMPGLKHHLSVIATKKAAATTAKEQPVYPWYNLGLYLRWSIGISKIEAYQTIPVSLVTEFTKLWILKVQHLIQQYNLIVQLLPHEEVSYEGNIAGMNSIISFTVKVPTGDKNGKEGLSLRELTLEEYKSFYRYMTMSWSSTDKTSINYDPIVGKRVWLGQPVKIAENGKTVLRIALGADMLISSLQHHAKWFRNEKAALTHLRNAFAEYTPSSTAITSTLFGATNPFLSVIHKVLQDDVCVIQKIFTLGLRWNDIHTASSLTTNEWLTTNTLFPVYFPSHQEKMRQLGNAFLLANVPFTPQTTATNLGIINLHHLQEALLHAEDIPSLSSSHNNKMCYDLDALQSAFYHVSTAFAAVTTGTNSSFTHCFAVKSCPVSFILQFLVAQGMGMECASINEVQQALKCGCPAERVIFDSPCKTMNELRFALHHSVRMNANSFADLEKIAIILKDFEEEGIDVSSLQLTIGLRINPLVGAGNISELSTATTTSKFGVALFGKTFPGGEDDNNVLQDEAFARIVQAFVKYPFLNGVMCHVGSQGMPIESMVQGVERIHWLAKYLDKHHASSPDSKRISWIDIGGGLSANYDDDKIGAAFTTYANQIAERCPSMFESTDSNTHPLRLFTEFGKSIVTKCGVIVCGVEDVLEHPCNDDEEQIVTGICHAGADLMLRTAYAPDKFPHRVLLTDASYNVLNGTTQRSLGTVNLVGPLCFSGDVVVRNAKSYPIPERGDHIVVLDAGANTLSIFSRHCSRNSPIVYAFRKIKYTSVEGELKEQIVIHAIRNRERDDEVLEFWE